MITKRIKNHKAFTLIELLVAISIISLIAMVFYTALSATIKSSTKNEIDIKALNLAQSEIEGIRNDIKLGKIIESRNIEEIKTHNSRTYKVTSNVIKNNNYMYQIEVMVKPQSNSGNFSSKVVRLSTEVFKKDNIST